MKVVQDMPNTFEAYIGDILFKNKENYNATKEILAKIKEKFGEVYNELFIMDLSYSISRYMFYEKSNGSMAALKKELKQNIKDAKSFETIEFALFKNDIYFEKNLNNEKYTKS